MKHCPKCQQTYADTQRFCVDDGELLSLRDPYHLVGRTLAEKYRIDALVGVGGMGAVYSAHHHSLDRRVAFKILLPHLTFGNPQTINLFEREAKIAGRLLHENIVSIFDAGRTTDDIAYIAMEWLDGRTLEDELKLHGRFSFERAADVVRQVASALEEAHARLIIHRDLKPSNVMLVKRLDGSDRVKVLDFGIGKVLNATAGAQVSSVMGTPHYASPEQFQVGASIDGRSDIYSFGIMIYEMLTGEVPFQATSVHEFINSQLTAAPRPLRQLRPEAPSAVEQLLNRLLSKDQNERPQRVGEIPALFDQALRTPDQPQVDAPKSMEWPVIPALPPEEKPQSPSLPPPPTPTPRLEEAPPKISPANDVADAPVSVKRELKAPQQVQKAAIPLAVRPDASPNAISESSIAIPQPSTSQRFNWRYMALGAAVLIAISIALWWIFRSQDTNTQVGPSPSPSVIPSAEPSKAAVSNPNPSRSRSAPEASNTVKPKPSPKSGDGSNRGVEKAIDGALGKEGKERKEDKEPT